MIQICHGMTEYVWRYKSFAEYFTSRGYVVFGNDIISHGRSNTQKSLGLYFTDWRNVYDDAEKAREYVQEKYPGLPVYILGFSRKGRVGCCRIYPCRGKRQTNPYKKIRRKFYFFVKIRNIIYAIQNRLSCEPAFVYVLHIQREYRDKLHLLILWKA